VRHLIDDRYTWFMFSPLILTLGVRYPQDVARQGVFEKRNMPVRFDLKPSGCGFLLGWYRRIGGSDGTRTRGLLRDRAAF
jgi:hypothetical protein